VVLGYARLLHAATAGARGAVSLPLEGIAHLRFLGADLDGLAAEADLAAPGAAGAIGAGDGDGGDVLAGLPAKPEVPAHALFAFMLVFVGLPENRSRSLALRRNTGYGCGGGRGDPPGVARAS